MATVHMRLSSHNRERLRTETLAKREMKESAARLAAWEKMAWDAATDSDMPADPHAAGSQHESHDTQMGLSASAATRHDSYQEQLVLAATLRESARERAASPGRNDSHMSEPLQFANLAELGLSPERKPRARRSRRTQSATSPRSSAVMSASISATGTLHSCPQSPDDDLQRALASSAQQTRQDEDAALQAALQESMQVDRDRDGGPPVQHLGAKRILI